eukprot:Phypoly_transcript_01060.p1 GENE.Phypoly_transcript_01060~~Phypoly_transcript_01060.p1  ORF type:complete len:847 (+),score=105.90 Phypoly_transcript_01060:1027-3567(+)
MATVVWEQIRSYIEGTTLRNDRKKITDWAPLFDKCEMEGLRVMFPKPKTFTVEQVKTFITDNELVKRVFEEDTDAAKAMIQGAINALCANPVRPVVTNSAEALLDRILHSNISGCTLKTDFLKPHRMSLGILVEGGKYIARDDAVHAFIKFAAERIVLRARPEPVSVDRLSNPLTATHTAPGGGKSTYVDLLASLVGTDAIGQVAKELCLLVESPTGNSSRRRTQSALATKPPLENAVLESYSKVGDIFSKSVPIVVTYNANTSFSKIDNDAEFGLACRVLYSFFCSQAKSNFTNFATAIEDVPLTFELALACIKRALPSTHTGIFLAVDELIKAGEGVGKVLDAICRCLNQDENFYAIVTTLYQSPVFAEKTKSGRIINWVKLRRPSFGEVLELFPDFKHIRTFRRCARDCNGHFRSVETLKTVWTYYAKMGILLDYADVMQQVAQKFPYPNQNLKIELVSAALCGAMIPLDATIGAKTFREHIADGVFLNALQGELKAVPLLSPLLLHQWALDTAGGGFGSQADAVARSIIRMMRLTPNFDWQQYEQFHAEWEVMKRALLLGKEFSVLDFYVPVRDVNLMKHIPHTIPESAKFEVQNKTVLPLKYQFKHYTSASGLTAGTQRDLGGAVCIPAAGNPGFDIVSLESTPTKELLALFIECRFSKPGSNTTLSPEVVKRKRRLTLSESHVPRGSAILVVCAFRKLDTKWYKKESGDPKSNKRSQKNEDEDKDENEERMVDEGDENEDESDDDYATQDDYDNDQIMANADSVGATQDSEDTTQDSKDTTQDSKDATQDSEYDLDYEDSPTSEVQQLLPPNTLVLNHDALRLLYTDSLVALPQFLLQDV